MTPSRIRPAADRCRSRGATGCLGAEHVGDLVGIRDHRGGPVRKDGARELVDHELGRFDMHVGVDEARYEVGAGHVEPFTSLIAAEPHHVAVLDRAVHVEPFLREHREDLATGQHEIGRFVTSRDRHPVFVDDGDFSDMAAAESGAIGRSLKRLEDGRLLRGEAQFVDDLRPERCLHVSLLRSPVASGRLAGVDTSAALAAPGIVAVFTAADLVGSCRPLAVHLTTPGAVSPERPILATDRVRFVGEMIAAVVADSRYLAADAVELISPDIEHRPAVVTFEDAVAESAPVVHEAVPENIYYLGHRSYGKVEDAFDRADVIVEGEVTHPRVAAAPIECRGVVASPDGDGGGVVWASTQVPPIAADAIAGMLRLERAEGRGVAARNGGAFGVKVQVYPEEILLAWIARRP